MKHVGKNAPCPCGSGKKYKGCCLRRRRAMGFTNAERGSAYLKLLDNVQETPAGWLDEASEVFWGSGGEPTFVQKFESGEIDAFTYSTSQQIFQFWYLFDYSSADGSRAAERFLDANRSLTSGERRYLEQATMTSVQLYEIVGIKPGYEMTLRNQISDEEVQCRDHQDSEELHKWDLLAARVMPGVESGQPEFEAWPMIFPRHRKADLLGQLDTWLSELREDRPESSENELFETVLPFLHRLWLQLSLEPKSWEGGASGSDLPSLVCSDLLDETKLQTTLDAYSRRYRFWLDEEIPVLEGATPREAVQSSLLRPKVIELLKDLEHHYERTLSQGELGFDPAWMWAELGLEDCAEAPEQSQQPALTGFESMERQVAGIGSLARKIASRFKRRGTTLLSPERLNSDSQFFRFLKQQAVAAAKFGSDPEAAKAHANLIGSHLLYMCNYALHNRKTFWVDASLAWMLGHTKLDLTGDHLRLPFPSFAVIFDDRYTLGLAEHLISLDASAELQGRMLKVVTAYVSELPAGKAQGIHVAFTFDALSGRWPYLFTRDLYFESDDSLEAILDSHFPDAEGHDSIFSSAPIKGLLHLLINAILYSTSAGIELELHSPPSQPARRTAKERSVFSSEKVYHLPGKINVSHLRQIQAVERAPEGRTLMHRFMVRGHWRRANPSWKDQSPRWIKPFWKGPDIAATIERAYKLKP